MDIPNTCKLPTIFSYPFRDPLSITFIAAAYETLLLLIKYF